MPRRSLLTIAILAGLLAAATPAHAGTFVGNPTVRSTVIDSVGTKYTMFLPLTSASTKNELTIETMEALGMFTQDAYDNEMGVRLFPDVDDEVLAPSVGRRS